MTFREKHRDLRENENVMRWYRNLQQGSLITGDVYLRTLGLYCKSNATSPEQILEDARTGKLKNAFIDFVRKQGIDGRADLMLSGSRRQFPHGYNSMILMPI